MFIDFTGLGTECLFLRKICYAGIYGSYRIIELTICFLGTLNDFLIVFYSLLSLFVNIVIERRLKQSQIIF